jgi:hypothetical protein
MAMEDIMGRVTDLAQAGAAKAREIAEIVKLKVSNASEEDAIRKAYLEIGKLYYDERGAAPEAPYAAACEKINASKEKIAYNKQKIADIKAAGNIKDEEIPDVDAQTPPTSDFSDTDE